MNKALIFVVSLSTSYIYAEPAICKKFVDDYEMNEYVVWDTAFSTNVFYILSYKLSPTRESVSFIPFDVETKYPAIIQCDRRNDSWIEYTTLDGLKRIKSIKKCYKFTTVLPQKSERRPGQSFSHRNQTVGLKLDSLSNKDQNNSTSMLFGCMTILKKKTTPFQKDSTILKLVFPVTLYVSEFDGGYNDINYSEIIAEFHNVSQQNFKIDLVQEKSKFCKNIQTFLVNCTQYHKRKFYKFTWFPTILVVVGISLALTLFVLKVAFNSERDVQDLDFEIERNTSSMVNFNPMRNAWKGPAECQDSDSVNGSCPY
jgi:hypothetical protein